MRGIMADKFQPGGIFAGDDLYGSVFFNGDVEVKLLTVDTDSQCGLGQTGTNGRSHFLAGHRTGELLFAAIRQGDIDHKNPKFKEARELSAWPALSSVCA